MNAIEKRAMELMDAECIVDAGSDGKAGTEAKIVHRAAIRAIIAALTPPEGYVLVPVEPTEAMQIAVEKANPWLIRYEAPEIWAAMLAARPEVEP